MAARTASVFSYRFQKEHGFVGARAGTALLAHEGGIDIGVRW